MYLRNFQNGLGVEMKQILWGVFCWMLSVTIASAASFDCGRASTKVEKLICANAELSKLDDDMGKAYLQAMDRIRKSNDQSGLRQRFVKSQRQWLKNERDVCQDAACVRTSYEGRLKEINFTPSFGFIFARPNKIKLPPPPPPPQSASRVNGIHTEANAEAAKPPVAQSSPVSAVDCGILIRPDEAKLPKPKLVTQLVETSRAYFEKQQFECAARAAEQANQVLGSIGDGNERATTGFEIKDAVFAMLQKGALPNHAFEKREIMAALQSVDANGALIKTASEDERFNDAAFLGNLADYYLGQRQQDDYRRVSSMMLMLDFTLPANRHFVDPARMHRYLNVLAYKLELQDLANLLDEAPESMRNALGKDIAYAIRQPMSGYALIGVTLLTPEKARQDVEAFNTLLPVIEAEKSGQSDFWIWPIYRFLAEAYWQSGDKEKAREMIGKARTSILSAKSYPKGSSTALEYFATSLCKYIRIEIGKGAEMCPIGIYDAKEMNGLFDEVEKVARLASDSHALATAGVLRKRLSEEAQ